MSVEDYLPYGCYEELDFQSLEDRWTGSKRRESNIFIPDLWYYYSSISAIKLAETSKAYKIQVKDLRF